MVFVFCCLIALMSLASARILGYNKVTLSVGDLNAAEKFYGAAFGFERVSKLHMSLVNATVMVLQIPQTTIQFELVQSDVLTGRCVFPTPPRQYQVAGLVQWSWFVANLSDAVTSLSELGVEPSFCLFNPGSGHRIAFFHDPWANIIELVENCGAMCGGNPKECPNDDAVNKKNIRRRI